MQYRNLGQCGLRVSALGFGCNKLGGRIDQETADRMVAMAIDHGITLFDTAESYSDGASEEALGTSIKSMRDKAVIATKFCATPIVRPVAGASMPASASRRYIHYAVDRSLQRLKTDWIDLYQLHWPDPSTPIEETVDALNELVRLGKIRYYGVSNFEGWQIADASWQARSRNNCPPISTQARWNILEREIEREIVPACARFGIGILPYFPLAAGLLGNREGAQLPAAGSHYNALANSPYAGGLADPETLDRVRLLKALAEGEGRTLLELALCWLLTQSSVGSVIAGPSTPAQLAQSLHSHDWALDKEILAKVDAITGVSKLPATFDH